MTTSLYYDMSSYYTITYYNVTLHNIIRYNAHGARELRRPLELVHEPEALPVEVDRLGCGQMGSTLMGALQT